MEIEDQLVSLRYTLSAGLKPENFDNAFGLVSYLLIAVRNPGNLQYIVGLLCGCSAVRNRDTRVAALLSIKRAIASAAYRKHQVTDPSITFDEWAAVIVRLVLGQHQSLEQSDPALVLAILTGLLAGAGNKHFDSYSQTVSEYFRCLVVCSSVPDEFVLSCMSLLPKLMLDSRCKWLQHEQILWACTSVAYPMAVNGSISYGSKWAEDIRSLSPVISMCLQFCDTRVFQEFCRHVVIFNTKLHQNQPGATVVKTAFFALALQLQGAGFRLLHGRKDMAVPCAAQIMLVFREFGPEIDELGEVFAPFAICWNLAIDTVLERSDSATADQILTESAGPEPRHRLFWLLVARLLIPKLSLAVLDDATQVLQSQIQHKQVGNTVGTAPSIEQSIFEAAHVVMHSVLQRAAIDNPANASLLCEKYAHTLLAQFPQMLQWKQVLIGWCSTMDNLANCRINTFSIIESLLAFMEGMPLSDDAVADGPPTYRAAIYTLMLHTVGAIDSAYLFGQCLARLEHTLRKLWQASDCEAQAYLRNTTLNWVQSLSLSHSDMGLRFWLTQNAKGNL